MGKFGWIAAGLLASTGMMAGLPAPAVAATVAQATTPASPDVDTLLEGMSRGEMAPIEQALAGPLPADTAALLRAARRAAYYDATITADPALARLAAAGSDPVLRRAALSLLTGAAFANADYAGAAQFGRQLEEALRANGQTREAAGVGRTWRLAALLADRSGMRQVTGAPGSIAATRDVVGMNRIEIGMNGIAQEAVIDTGANLSVLSAETARRLGVTQIEGGVDVENSVEGTVPVRVGIVDRLEIAGTILRNVPVLIVDDSALSFTLPTGPFSIKAIIGLPELRALGRVQISATRFAVLAPAAAGAAEAQNMHGNAGEIYVDVALDGRTVALLLDTGANRTSLSARYATANAAAVAALATRSASNQGAGGARVQAVARWTEVPVAVGGQALVLPEITIALPASGGPLPQGNGTFGQDVLRRFESYTLDFRAMRLSLGAPVVAAR